MNIFIKFYNNLLKYGLEYFGLFYSTYRGIVTDVDDPLKIGRIKVKVPSVLNEQIEEWAFPTAIASKGSGFVFIPKVGDMVRVKFEGGNVRFPVWSYGWWTKGNFVDRASQDYGNRVGIYFGGHYIEIDSTKDTVRVCSSSSVVEVSNKVYIGNDLGNLMGLIDSLVSAAEKTTVQGVPFTNLPEWTALRFQAQTFLSDSEK